MSKRAEEAALKAYPGADDVEFYYETEPGVFSPVTTYGLEKRCFIQGYEQAEKDLSLTWKDVMVICEHYVDVNYEYDYHSIQEKYEEVLRRFKEDRK